MSSNPLDTSVSSRASQPDPADPPVSGPRALLTRPSLALLTFALAVSAVWVGHRLATNKPLSLPHMAFIPTEKDKGLRGPGPLPTAAEAKFRPPEALPTTEQPVEEPPGGALDGFFRSLQRTERKEPGAITRVIHWGDSQIVSDNVTSTLRRKLQGQFGDAGHGFHSVDSPPSYLHSDVWHWTKGWKSAGITGNGFHDRRHGLGATASYSSEYGPMARFETRDSYPVGKTVSRFDVAYLEHPGGGRFQVSVDGEVKETINTRGPALRDAVHHIGVPDGPHRFMIRALGFGESRIYGVVMERDVPGVVYDSLGLKGAQLHDLLRLDHEHLKAQLAWRKPALVVFGFGTNESYQAIEMADYKPRWREIFQLVRSAIPDGSCLVLAPVDRVHLGKESHPRTAKLTAALREVALAEGCAFWDTFAAMGGDQAAVKWRKAGLMWGDLAHLNPAGGERLGTMLATALVERYRAWKQRQPPR